MIFFKSQGCLRIVKGIKLNIWLISSFFFFSVGLYIFSLDMGDWGASFLFLTRNSYAVVFSWEMRTSIIVCFLGLCLGMRNRYLKSRSFQPVWVSLQEEQSLTIKVTSWLWFLYFDVPLWIIAHLMNCHCAGITLCTYNN